VILVPATAVFQRGQAMVAFVVSGKTIDQRTVSILRRGRDEIAIASGLHEGERVATRDPEYIEGVAK